MRNAGIKINIGTSLHPSMHYLRKLIWRGLRQLCGTPTPHAGKLSRGGGCRYTEQKAPTNSSELHVARMILQMTSFLSHSIEYVRDALHLASEFNELTLNVSNEVEICGTFCTAKKSELSRFESSRCKTSFRSL
jgi:hypothetical protein